MVYIPSRDPPLFLSLMSFAIANSYTVKRAVHQARGIQMFSIQLALQVEDSGLTEILAHRHTELISLIYVE